MDMKAYIGSKIILAEPMTKNEFEKLQDRTYYPHDTQPGYHVQYSNPDGSIYNSWSPTDVFENAYRLVSEGEACFTRENEKPVSIMIGPLDKYIKEQLKDWSKSPEGEIIDAVKKQLKAAGWIPPQRDDYGKPIINDGNYGYLRPPKPVFKTKGVEVPKTRRPQ